MIITKGVAVGEVVTLKLVTGEELIAKLTDISDNDYKVTRPLMLVIGSQGLGLQPWLLSVESTRAIKIPKERVIAIEPTIKEMSTQYLAGTSGIALA